MVAQKESVGVQRESMRDRVKQILIERILDGTYTPGDRLVELQIAKELDVSQAPVREAFRELEAIHLVESEAYRGTRVREISRRELIESYQVRGNLEVLAARLATPKLKANPKPLIAIHKSYCAVTQAQDIKRFAKHNAAFHRLIVESADNEVLLRVWNSLSFETLTLLCLQRLQPENLNWISAFSEHQAIVDAMIVGDAEAAEQLMHQHTESVLVQMTNSQH